MSLATCQGGWLYNSMTVSHCGHFCASSSFEPKCSFQALEPPANKANKPKKINRKAHDVNYRDVESPGCWTAYWLCSFSFADVFNPTQTSYLFPSGVWEANLPGWHGWQWHHSNCEKPEKCISQCVCESKRKGEEEIENERVGRCSEKLGEGRATARVSEGERERVRQSGRTVQPASLCFSRSIHSGAERTGRIGEGRSSKNSSEKRGYRGKCHVGRHQRDQALACLSLGRGVWKFPTWRRKPPCVVGGEWLNFILEGRAIAVDTGWIGLQWKAAGGHRRGTNSVSLSAHTRTFL